MSSDRNSTNYQQQPGANDLISSSTSDIKQEHIQIKSEQDNYHHVPTMSHTKTMILGSSGQFQYVNQPPLPPPSSQEYTSTTKYFGASESGDGYESVSSGGHSVKSERNGQAVMLVDAAHGAISGRFAVGLTSLPPPPPPTVTITSAGGNGNFASSNQVHQTIIVGRSAVSSTSTTVTQCYGRLSYKDDILYISEHTVEIGRNSSTSTVQFHVGKNSFVSRKHLKLLHDQNSNEFYLMCLSKNGVFVNDAFQRKSSEPLKLPKTCTFRFPSTSIRILFESYTDHPFEPPTKSNKTVENSNVIYAPLKISIPEHDKKSPFPSPTGTISAANSCPTSPRQNYQDYHHNIAAVSAYSTYNHHNNNHIQNSGGNATNHSNNSHNFENDLFPPPATSSFNDFEKPPYSYAQLIVQSISASPEKQLTLSGIYSFISKHYPYYRKEANKGWQNSIRHNLSLNRYFIKVARSQDEPGKGSFWRIDPNSEAKLIDQSYKKRRQRGSQCFRAPYGMPRSAPVSPSHHGEYNDNSADNSPLHIVLQSAPGSPGAYHTIHHDNHSGEENNFGGQHQLIQGLSSFNNSSTNQLSSSYVNPNAPSNSAIVSTTSVTSAPVQQTIIKRTIQPNAFQQTYEEQSLSSSSSSSQPIHQNQHQIHQIQKHQASSIGPDSDDDDEYNHNIPKRHKYEAGV